MNTIGQKVVIDTNIFITIIGRRSPNRWIFDKIISGDFQLCITNEILWEYEEILTQKTNGNIARNIIDFLLISPFVHKVEVFYNWQLISNDPDDNKFVDCYLSSDAICLISNDQHFEKIKRIDFPKINLYSLVEFEQEFKNP